MVVIKSSFDGDLRRFTVDTTTNFDTFCTLLKNLYKRSCPLLVKYIDEEGDQISLTNDFDFAEALRLASTTQPAVLRVFVTQAATTASDPPKFHTTPTEQPTPNQHVVYWQGKPFVIDLCAKQPEEKKIVIPFTLPSQSVNSPSFKKPVGQTIGASCINLAQDTRKLCIDTSNSIMKETQQICEDMASTIKNTAVTANNVATIDKGTQVKMEELSKSTSQAGETISNQTRTASNKNSNDILATVFNIPADTVALQNDALKNLMEQISRNVAETLASVLSTEQN